MVCYQNTTYFPSENSIKAWSSQIHVLIISCQRKAKYRPNCLRLYILWSMVYIVFTSNMPKLDFAFLYNLDDRGRIFFMRAIQIFLVFFILENYIWPWKWFEKNPETCADHHHSKQIYMLRHCDTDFHDSVSLSQLRKYGIILLLIVRCLKVVQW